MEDSTFKELIESLDCCVVQTNNAGYISYCSPQITTLCGFHPDALIGKNLCELFVHEEGQNMAADLPLLLSLHKPVRRLPVKILDNNQLVQAVELSLSFSYDDSGLPLGYRGFVQKASKPANLVNEQMTWIEALENIIEAVVMVDTDFRIHYANQNFYDLFDYKPIDVIEKPLSILNYQGEHESLQPMAIVEAINQHGFWQGEVKRRAKHGNYIPVLLSARPYMDSRGNHKGYIGTYLDLRTINSSEIKTKRSLLSVFQVVMAAMDRKLTGRVGYLERVSDLCVAIGLEMGLDNKALEGLRLGALLHDLGKLNIPQEILSKRHSLNQFEMEFLNNHPKEGSSIISHLYLPWPVSDMILQHHERMDGSGYPEGLEGGDIVLEARIIAVVDTLEAVCQDPESYGLTILDLPISVLEKDKGIKFDAEVVEVCARLIRTGQYPEFLTLDNFNAGLAAAHAGAQVR